MNRVNFAAWVRTHPLGKRTVGGSMQQRRETDRRHDPSEGEEIEKPESVPSFLTARELQAREPATEQPEGEKPVGERRTLKERRRNPA